MAVTPKQPSMPSVRVRELPDIDSGSPYSFSGTTTLTTGATLPVQEEALKNNTGRTIEVRELKFVFTLGVPAGAVEAAIAVVTARGVVKPITNAPVPVSMLGIRRGMTSEVFTYERLTILGYNTMGDHVWRLDAPLYLLPGEALRIMLGHRGLVSNDIIATVTASGRFVQRAPARRLLPYIAGYIGTQIDLSTFGATYPGQTTTPKHLVNALRVPVSVSRFIGRIGAISTGAYAEASRLAGDDFAERYLMVTMRSSQGVPNIRFPTPFARAFEQISCSWECAHTLPPGAYYIVNVLGGTNTITGRNLQVTPMVTMIGVREDK